MRAGLGGESATVLLRAGSGGLALLLVLSVSACGGSGSSHQLAASPSEAPSSRAASFAAYRQCLSEHGVAMPTGRPTPGAPRPTPDPGQGAAFREARQACASLRPAGGLSAGGIHSGPRRQFRECMSQHGVQLPAPPRRTAPPGEGPTPEPSSGRGGMLAGLDRNDPTVRKALDACGPLLIKNADTPAPASS